MQDLGIVVVLAGILAFALVSKKLEGTPITLPIVFTLGGWMIGTGGLGLVNMDPGHGVIHIIAELTLILVLFSDAARIDVMRLKSDHILPVRMLAIGMPLTVLLGALTAWLIFPGVTIATAFLVAAILTPTDAALGQSVVSSPVVPVRIRQALNVESGLNDGIALPLVLICAIWAGAPSSGSTSGSALFKFATLQVTLGPLIGGAVGFLSARMVDMAVTRQWITGPFEGIAILSTAVLAFALAELVGGNGFIAAFSGGLVFGGLLRHPCRFLYEFMESEGQLLTLLTFFIFGAFMLPPAIEHATPGTFILALAFLTLVRMVPIAISISGLGLSWPSKLFLGWFGPRGLASILFALLILEKYPVSGTEEILACVVITVGLSILLHGLSAAPFAKMYGAFTVQKGEGAEMKPVSEMPVRHGMSRD